MKKVYITILFFVLILVFKNYFLESLIVVYLKDNNTTLKNIDCNGIYNINCKITSLESNISNNHTLYYIKVNKMNIVNIYNLYNSYKKRELLKGNFIININDLSINDSRNAFDKLSNPLNIDINGFKNTLLLNGNALNIKIKREQNLFDIYTEIKNNITKEYLYELYKLKYLETKEIDSKEIAKGINISFGFNTDSVIPREEFIKDAMPRMIDLIVSELESLDNFNKYNKNEQLSKILESILEQNGTKNYKIVIKEKSN